MLLITQVSSNPLQERTFLLGDGSQFTFSLYFVPLQAGWFIPQLVYGDFTINGLRISNSPNMLHQFRNQLPFGLACYSDANREPALQEDFSSNASRLYVLTADEVQEYQGYLTGG